MYTKTTTVINVSGLHARPAQQLVTQAKQFKSKITIRKAGAADEANAKSIISLLSQSFSRGSVLTISASGEDEALAVDTLIDLISSGFGEGEDE